jgi:hypothetical protein
MDAGINHAPVAQNQLKHRAGIFAYAMTDQVAHRVKQLELIGSVQVAERGYRLVA